MILAGNDTRLALIAQSGVTPLDRRKFGELSYDERRFATDAAYRRSYIEAESAFLAEVERRTGGLKV